MATNKDITVIIPVHKLDDTSKGLFRKAIQSILANTVVPQNVLVVTHKADDTDVQVCEILKEFLTGTTVDFKVRIHDRATDFCTQINVGVEEVTTEFFSILEFDDEYSSIYFLNALEYINAYPEVGMFLPITVEVDKENKMLHYTNEAVWAQGFGEKLGHLDLNTLLEFENFSIGGSVINKEKFLEYGGLKNNIKIFFAYEFLLRFVNEDGGVMTIPKIGYRHLNFREDSLFENYKKEVKPEEVKFYHETAKNEYFFNPNQVTREITYTPATTVEDNTEL